MSPQSIQHQQRSQVSRLAYKLDFRTITIEFLFKIISKLISGSSGSAPTEFQVMPWESDSSPSNGRRGNRPHSFRTRWNASIQ